MKFNTERFLVQYRDCGTNDGQLNDLHVPLTFKSDVSITEVIFCDVQQLRTIIQHFYNTLIERELLRVRGKFKLLKGTIHARVQGKCKRNQFWFE